MTDKKKAASIVLTLTMLLLIRQNVLNKVEYKKEEPFNLKTYEEEMVLRRSKKNGEK